MREAEEVKKKGWFSRNKQRGPSEATSTSTSRPASTTPAGKTQKADESAGDDLPPREVNTPEVPTTHAPGTAQQPNDVADDTSELPSHAGFDLAAMKAVIEGIEGNKEKPRDVGGPTRPEIPPPLPPQGIVEKNTSSTSSLVTKSSEVTPISESPSGVQTPTTSNYRGSRPTSIRSVSLNNTRPFESQNATEDSDEDSTLNVPSSSTFTPHARVAADTTLTFKGDYKASWTPEVPDKDSFGGFGTPIGNPFHSTTFSAGGSTAVTALPPATSTASPAVSIADRDPWSFPSYSGDVAASASVKKPSVFATNPWES